MRVILNGKHARFWLKDDTEKVEEDTDRRARGEHGRKNEKIFSDILIDTEKHEDADARVCDQTCEHGTRRDDAVKEKLGDDDGGRAVRDQTHQSGHQVANHRRCGEKRSQLVLSDSVEKKVEQKGKEQDEQGNVQGVPNGGKREMLAATAMLTLAKLLDAGLGHN